jgi:aspartyl-tRNA(Asn)/glutamyl-tRNA(Gln) amidotransferase subunit A
LGRRFPWRLAKVTSDGRPAAYLAAIDKYNGKTNAILTKLEELAMEQAARADKAEQRCEWLGLLHGVCITLKDCLHVAGYRTMYGSALYAEQMSKSDSAVVARLRQAGAIFLGKSFVLRHP